MKRFSLSAILACLLLTQTNAQVDTQDSLALINIYNSTKGAEWTQKWTRTQPVNTWFGVTITAGRVTGLNLPGNNLNGKIPTTAVAKLTQLKTIDVSNNKVVAYLPAALANLTDLEEINFSNNDMWGNIPSGLFTNLTKLKKFNVADNGIESWIPSSIGSAVALQEFDISRNHFANKIPAGVNSLTHLTKFLAANNKLVGPLPTGKLCSPTVQVDISGNQFTFAGTECLGANPNAVYNNQKELTLTQNNLTLSVAAGGTLVNNTYTWYRNGGSTPYFVATGNNKLNVVATGSYTVKVTNSVAPALTLQTNNVSLTVNSLATDSLALVDLYHATNGPGWTNKTNWLTTTPLSQWYGVQVVDGRVESLLLSNNNLEGELPGTFQEIGLAYELLLNGNRLTGAIPGSFVTHSVFHIDLSHNQFTTIPANYSNTSVFIDLSYNLLSGSIPSAIFNAQYVNLNNNRFTFAHFGNLTRTDEDVIIHPQATIPIIDQNPVFKVSPGGTPSDNTYSWYRISGLQKVASNGNDSSFLVNNAGSHWATVTNTKFPSLTLYTDTIEIETVIGRLAEDSLILVQLYNSTKGPNWVNRTNWLTSAPLETWYGVGINQGRVESLYLQENNLQGNLPPSFKNLPLIHELYLSGNKLTGGIPSSFVSGGIAFIDLSNNLLTSLPSDFNVSSIDLNLSGNRLTGKLPALIAASTGFLDVRDNRLTFDGIEPLNLEISKVQPQQRIPIINTNPVLKAAAGGTLANNTYKWYKNTGYFTTKVGDSTLTITTPGVYHCIVTNSAVPGVELRTNNANISTVSSRKIQPGETMDGDLVSGTSGKLSVYPNPAVSDFIYIKGLQKAEAVLLYNASGQLVKQWQNVSGNQQLNISGVTSGVYIVKVVEKDKLTLLKFVRQ